MNIERLLKGSRVFFQLLLHKVSGRRSPVIMNILVTNRCNLNCYYCYPQVYRRKLKRELSLNEILSFIDEGYKLGTRIIVLLGGEPLLRPDIDDIISHIKSKRIVCELITNGYFYDRHRDKLKMLDSLCVSIDGDKETNDRNRGVGSFNRALDCLRKAVKDGLKVRIHAVITRDSMTSMDYLALLAKKENVSLSFAQPAKNAPHKNLCFTEEEIRHFLQKSKDLKKAGYPIINTFDALEYCIRWHHGYDRTLNISEIQNADEKYVKCLRSQLTSYVDADGFLKICPFVWDKGFDIHEKGFTEAWNCLADWDCYACPYISEVDLNLLLGLNSKSIINSAYFYLQQVRNEMSNAG